MRSSAVLSTLLASALLLAFEPAAAADTVIAQERAPSKISAELNRVVWSSYEAATGNYYLMSRETQGAVTRLPIAPRKVPFDVDLGYLGEGAEVASYSRCAGEPNPVGGGSGGLLPDYATGRGCDIYLFDFAAQRETRYTPTAGGRASEFLPSVAPAGRIAFARVYERRRGRRGRVPYLYAKRGRSVHRIPGGSRGTTGLPGPTSLDLKGRLLAFGWDFSRRNRGIGASEARVATVAGSTELLESETTGLAVRLVITPGLASGPPGPAGGIYWGRIITTGDAGGLHKFLVRESRSRQRIRLGPLDEAPAPQNVLSLACGLSCADSLYYVAIPSLSLRRAPGGAPICGPLDAPAACTVALSGSLSFVESR
jgi:hypothetical protein